MARGMRSSSFLGLSAILVLGAASASELVVNVGLQTGSFLIGSDISGLNAHDYRPNEFVTSDVRQSTCSKPQTQDPRCINASAQKASNLE